VQVPTELMFEARCISARIEALLKREVKNKLFYLLEVILYYTGEQGFGHVALHVLSQMVLDRCLTLIPNVNSVFFYML